MGTGEKVKSCKCQAVRKAAASTVKTDRIKERPPGSPFLPLGYVGNTYKKIETQTKRRTGATGYIIGIPGENTQGKARKTNATNKKGEPLTPTKRHGTPNTHQANARWLSYYSRVSPARQEKRGKT